MSRKHCPLCDGEQLGSIELSAGMGEESEKS